MRRAAREHTNWCEAVLAMKGDAVIHAKEALFISRIYSSCLSTDVSRMHLIPVRP